VITLAIRKSIYFSDELDGDILGHVRQLTNFSGYIKKLISIDIERGITNVIHGRKTEIPEASPKVIHEETASDSGISDVSHISNTPKEIDLPQETKPKEVTSKHEEKTHQPKPIRTHKPKQQIGKRIEGKQKESKPLNNTEPAPPNVNFINQKRRQFNG
jgi:hypothetical protein